MELVVSDAYSTKMNKSKLSIIFVKEKISLILIGLSQIQQEGSKRLFDLSYQSDVTVLGPGTSQHHLLRAETWLWQLVRLQLCRPPLPS